MQKHDRIRLQHMLDATNEALEFIQGKRRSDLDTDRKLVLSLVKELEIMVKRPARYRPKFEPQYGRHSLARYKWNA